MGGCTVPGCLIRWSFAAPSASSLFPAWSARLSTPRCWLSGPRCTFRFARGFFT